MLVTVAGYALRLARHLPARALCLAWQAGGPPEADSGEVGGVA